MTQTQIKYFLAAARCLNFTEAARQLHITQPALSQQITAIESELNMQLFIRHKNKLRLTPAALVFLEELPPYERQFESIVEKARIAHQGNGGILRIGVLEGQMLPPNFRQAYHVFCSMYPGVYIRFSVGSFGILKTQLDNGEIDIALTADFDIKDDVCYLYEKVDINQGVALVSKEHPIAKSKISSLADLKDENIILINFTDTERVKSMVLNDCQAAGFVPNLLLASTLDEQMLWIDAGLGVGIINTNSYISVNPNIRRLENLHIGENYFVIVWHRNNINRSVALFSNFVSSYIEEKQLL